MRTYPADERVSVFVGQRDIPHDHRRAQAIERRERLAGGSKRRDGRARIPQRPNEQFAAVGMILEQHDGTARGGTARNQMSEQAGDVLSRQRPVHFKP
jgi:hypothetical protein